MARPATRRRSRVFRCDGSSALISRSMPVSVSSIPNRSGPLRADPTDVGDPPSGDPVLLGVGTAQDRSLGDRLFAVVEPRASPGSRPIEETGDAVGIEATDPVSERPAIRARRLDHRLPARAGRSAGDRRRPRRRTPVGREPRMSPKRTDLDVRSDRDDVAPVSYPGRSSRRRSVSCSSSSHHPARPFRGWSRSWRAGCRRPFDECCRRPVADRAEAAVERIDAMTAGLGETSEVA